MPQVESGGRRGYKVIKTFKDGYVEIQDAPGLGIDVNEAAAKKYPYLRRSRPTIRRRDGSPWPY